MYCAQCGTKNSVDSKFCGDCGNKLISPDAPTTHSLDDAKDLNYADIKQKMATFEKVEDITCIHCGSKNPKGVNSCLKSNTITSMIYFFILGGGISLAMISSGDEGSFRVAALATLIACKAIHHYGKAKHVYCGDCNDYFYADKNGSTSKTKI